MPTGTSGGLAADWLQGQRLAVAELGWNLDPGWGPSAPRLPLQVAGPTILVPAVPELLARGRT